MLTRKQKELLLLIRDHMAADGVSPSFDEMKEALGLKSKSGIHRLITGLEERGFLKRLPHRARALEILKFPESIDSKTKPTKKRLNVATLAAEPDVSLASNINLPLYGRIAAGFPIEAFNQPSGYYEVPVSMLTSARGQTNGEHYVLQIAGESMIEAGIMNGDYVIICKTETAENGQIVVALVDEQEATLKYFKRDYGVVSLIPANAKYQPQNYAASRIRIQGKLVGLIRKY